MDVVFALKEAENVDIHATTNTGRNRFIRMYTRETSKTYTDLYYKKRYRFKPIYTAKKNTDLYGFIQHTLENYTDLYNKNATD